jgi:hypothetical protein
MSGKTKKNTGASGGAGMPPGLIVPIDVQALCVGNDNPAIFEPAPYDFSLLPSSSGAAANLSDVVMTGGPTTLGSGIHLHWALPDALTHGVDKEGTGNAVFPHTPDRWLVTRLAIDSSNPGEKPQVQSWLVESNYCNKTKPGTRESITVPYLGDKNRPYRYLGRVTKLEESVTGQNSAGNADSSDYVPYLPAVGYGIPEFAASYHTCKSVFGFYDTADDLAALPHPGKNKLVSYHVVGWYSQSADDPLQQPPQQIAGAVFAQLLNRISDPADKTYIKQMYLPVLYELPDGVSYSAKKRVWAILTSVGYDLPGEIPAQIKAVDFDNMLSKIKDPGDKNLVETTYRPVYGLPAGQEVSSTDKQKIWTILYATGFDFLGSLLEAYKWSLPSGTPSPPSQPQHTLFTGIVCNVTWNETTGYFEPIDSSSIDIAVGNTPEEAMAALIAGVIDLPNLPVELILDALQMGLLDKVTDVNTLGSMEELQLAIHKNAFAAGRGGYIWQIEKKAGQQKDGGEVTLPDTLAEDLNRLNIYQQQYNEAQNTIESMRRQIFSHWYYFMQRYHYQETNPFPELQPEDIAKYITAEIDKLNTLVQNTNDDKIDNQKSKIKDALDKLGKNYVLDKIPAPRYWHPHEPVVLFMGEQLDPPARYGGDGGFMYNDTMVCRLAGQVTTSLTIAPDTLGNHNRELFDSTNLPRLPASSAHLNYGTELSGLFTESCLLDANVIASELLAAGVKNDFNTLVEKLRQARDSYLAPAIPLKLSGAEFQKITDLTGSADKIFFQGMYTKQNSSYDLRTPLDQLSADDRKRLDYIFISASYQAGGILFTGIAPSQIALQYWTGTPWLPFSLKWSVQYYPLENINTDKGKKKNYEAGFITANFDLGDVNLEYSGSSSLQDLQLYSNSIFMTPHAVVNFKKKLGDFIRQHPGDQIDPELQKIIDKMGDLPVLSQALSGFNDALDMRKKEMQLAVGDPAATGPFYDFSNTRVKNAVANMNTAAPRPDNCFNPIRAGLMKIGELTIVDIFGRNLSITSGHKIYRARDMVQDKLQPDADIYLAPRLTQPARLLFRWLSAYDDLVEMNSHPASTPICGWVLCNHLDPSLWIYDNKGNALGSLILTGDGKRVIWQCVPGGSDFGEHIEEFFTSGGGKDVNEHLKQFVLALYNRNGDPAYLEPFMRALDKSAALIEPQNHKQYDSDAVLMGRPLALVRASLQLELQGLPVYNQSKTDFVNQVFEYKNKKTITPCDNNFTGVQFPVRLGAMARADDGLVGYFKDGNYDHFYALAAPETSAKVSVPADDNITLTCRPDADPIMVSILVEPRGSVHATSGLLPVKAINIPPDQYVAALKALKLAFLFTPIVSSASRLAFPKPAESGGQWSWVENEKKRWSETKKINPVNDRAAMNYSPQQISEGWLKLAGFEKK